MQDNTLGFYNSNAIDYAADGETPNPKLFSFLKRCKPAGRILNWEQVRAPMRVPFSTPDFNSMRRMAPPNWRQSLQNGWDSPSAR